MYLHYFRSVRDCVPALPKPLLRPRLIERLARASIQLLEGGLTHRCGHSIHLPPSLYLDLSGYGYRYVDRHIYTAIQICIYITLDSCTCPAAPESSRAHVASPPPHTPRATDPSRPPQSRTRRRRPRRLRGQFHRGARPRQQRRRRLAR